MMKSYFHQPGTQQSVFETIPERIQKLAEEKPEKPAMVFYEGKKKEHRRQISRRDLWERVEKFGRSLLKWGLEKGDLVGYSAPNLQNWLAYDIGIMFAGGVSVHLPYGDEHNILETLQGCHIAIIDSKKDWDDIMAISTMGIKGEISCPKIPTLKLIIAATPANRPEPTLLTLMTTDMMADVLIEMLHHTSALVPLNEVDPEDVAFINVFKGADGKYKRVEHTHFDAINCPSFLSGGSESTEDDVRYVSGYLSETKNYPFGLIQMGSKVVTGEPEFLNDPKNFDFITKFWKKEGCSIVSMVPGNLKNLKDFGYRARLISTMDDNLTKEMITNGFLLADKVVVIYDTTEALRISHRVFTKSNIDEHKPGMLGRATEGVEIKIINDQGITVEHGEKGTVCVRSPWLTRGSGGQGNDSIGNMWYKTNFVARMVPGGDLMK